MKYYKVVAKNNCPFCLRAKLLLIEREQNFEYCLIDHSPDLWEVMKNKYDHRTVPMIFIKDTATRIEKLIGGYDNLVEHFYSFENQEDE